jgi:hypothetical protein
LIRLSRTTHEKQPMSILIRQLTAIAGLAALCVPCILFSSDQIRRISRDDAIRMAEDPLGLSARIEFVGASDDRIYLEQSTIASGAGSKASDDRVVYWLPAAELSADEQSKVASMNAYPAEHAASFEYVVLTGNSARTVFSQCSRLATEPDSICLPEKYSIDTAMVCLKNLDARIRQKLPLPLNRYRYQIVEYKLNGTPYLYLNCFEKSAGPHGIRWKSDPVIACEGGASFWGIVFDLSKKVFIEFRINPDA